MSAEEERAKAAATVGKQRFRERELLRKKLIALVLARVAEEHNGPEVWPDHSPIFPAQWGGRLEFMDQQIDEAALELVIKLR